MVGFDGPGEIGTTELADKVAEALQAFGRPVIRASTDWWWRPPALRLEFGREDVDMLLTGWVDGQALRRELIDPVHRPGSNYITRLRDPVTGRSIKQPPRTVSAPAGVCCWTGHFCWLPTSRSMPWLVSRCLGPR